MQIPDAFMRKEAAKLNIQLPAAGQYAVGNVFLPQASCSLEGLYKPCLFGLLGFAIPESKMLN